MNLFSKGMFALVVLPLLLLLTGCNSGNALPEKTVTPEVKLEHIDIIASPITTRGVSELTLAVGNQQPFEAIGRYSDGSSHTLTDLSVTDWHTSEQDIGYFNAPGVLVGAKPGSATVTATKDGITSNAVSVNVTAATITAIQVTPATVNVAKGQAQQLTATATYSDNTSSDVTDSVTWTPDDTTTASVTSAGLLSGVEMGSMTVTATKDGISSNTVNITVSAAVITALQVTPATVNVAKGQTQQLTATATYSDNTSSDVTDSVTWAADDTTTASVTSAGLLSGVEMGSMTVTATKDGISSNTVNVTVSAAVITALQVTPATVNVAKGQTQQLTATATYSDNTSSDVTDSVTWAADDITTATVTSAGLLSGIEVGATTLTATKDGISSNTVDVTVSAAVITSIQVTPSIVDINVAMFMTQQLTATATYSDSTSSDISSSVTWTSDNTNTATVTSTGLLSGVEGGSTTVVATKDNISSNTVSVNVCNLAGACLDILDVGSGKLFTSSPSVAYLDSIGGGANNTTTTETGSDGPAGTFYTFSWDDAKALCETYNNNDIGGRTNWRLATKDELLALTDSIYSSMFRTHGWPTSPYYWSATPDGSNYYGVFLGPGKYVTSNNPIIRYYASCVSDIQP
ncbi:Ig-like domain-containing protein [Aeromonas caviae]|uniref:Ig-like domain-containing protein n=1 Tax=Aeromonas caviae TaxID=648 RepID=UPI002B49D646|nr:Ig-like domain-containing protein [Aeromonas caviae]